MSGVEKSIKEGKICFLIIDVQGAQSIMKLRPDAITIFLLLEVMEKLLDVGVDMITTNCITY